MLVETIYTGIKICALASVCAYGWLRVQQERKAETAKEQAEKTTCKNCCYCRMIMTDSRIVCELEEKPIEQPAHCMLFTEWPEDYTSSLCLYCKHCKNYGKFFVSCDISGLRDKAEITCINYEKRRKYFPDLGGIH